jgi:hypothetical protein
MYSRALVGNALRTALSALLLSLPLAAQMSQAQIDSLAAFRLCISVYGTDSTCTLDPYTTPYEITQTLEIARNISVVRGGGITPENVVVKRTSSTMPEIMKVLPGVSGVTIRDMTFDGNRSIVSPLNLNTVAGWADLSLAPSTNGNITVTDANFVNSPGYSMTVAKTNTTVQFVHASGGYMGGIDSYDSATTNVTVQFSTFSDFGGGAVILAATSGGTVGYNQFNGNHREFPNGQPGGQLFINRGTSSVYVIGNQFDGENVYSGWMVTTGIECYGSNHHVTGNSLINHRGSGMSFAEVTGLVVGTGDYNNGANYISANSQNGLAILGLSGLGNSSNITIDGNMSVDNGMYNIYVNADPGTSISNFVVHPLDAHNILTPCTGTCIAPLFLNCPGACY